MTSLIVRPRSMQVFLKTFCRRAGTRMVMLTISSFFFFMRYLLPRDSATFIIKSKRRTRRVSWSKGYGNGHSQPPLKEKTDAPAVNLFFVTVSSRSAIIGWKLPLVLWLRDAYHSRLFAPLLCLWFIVRRVRTFVASLLLVASAIRSAMLSADERAWFPHVSW